ncbi:MAG: CIA30 family protein [Pseudohongiellaceae bacterium]
MFFTITAMWRKLGVTVLSVLSVCLLGQPLTAEEEDLLKPLLLIAFEQDSPDVGWYVQNDNVMGGQSVGGFSVQASELVFSGNTNTNGGGFSSIRSEPLELDLADYDGIRLTVKADGRRYTWSLQTDARWRGRKINYWADFDTVPGEVYVVDVPFERFMPQFRGFKLDGPTLDRSQIREFALYQYDKTDGPFELRLIKAEAYTDGH